MIFFSTDKDGWDFAFKSDQSERLRKLWRIKQLKYIPLHPNPASKIKLITFPHFCSLTSDQPLLKVNGPQKDTLVAESIHIATEFQVRMIQQQDKITSNNYYIPAIVFTYPYDILTDLQLVFFTYW